MELQRCRICGRIHLGNHPTRCPYCGAFGKYIVPLLEWTDENAQLTLDPDDIKRLKITRELEYTNTRFYLAAAKETTNSEIFGFFIYLANIELEHYRVAVEILGEDVDHDIYLPSSGLGSDINNLNHSLEKEEHASKLYAGFVTKTNLERLKTLFSALSEVESDHIYLDNQEISLQTK